MGFFIFYKKFNTIQENDHQVLHNLFTIKKHFLHNN